MRPLIILALLIISQSSALAAPKSHGVVLGKWTTVKWLIGPDESQPLDLKVRPLIVDGKAKEFVTGLAHDITEQLFLVRRAFRLNDSLPDDKPVSLQWQWQRGGWLLVDRSNGHVSRVSLPEYDYYLSAIAWYRDYAAYCGVGEDGKKVFAVVAQLGRRQPVLKKALGEVSGEDIPDSACSAPVWQRQPARVTFSPGQGAKVTYAIRGHAAAAVTDGEEDEQAAK